MIKVTHADLESVTKFLDKIAIKQNFSRVPSIIEDSKKAEQLSKMIKDKYTEIKPDYDRTN